MNRKRTIFFDILCLIKLNYIKHNYIITRWPHYNLTQIEKKGKVKTYIFVLLLFLLLIQSILHAWMVIHFHPSYYPLFHFFSLFSRGILLSMQGLQEAWGLILRCTRWIEIASSFCKQCYPNVSLAVKVNLKNISLDIFILFYSNYSYRNIKRFLFLNYACKRDF